MAKETNLEQFIGTDKTWAFPVLSLDETVAIDASSWALSWMLKRRLSMADNEASITRTVANGGIVVSGVFNADPALNAQRVRVTLLDTQTDPLAAGTWFYELKRTNDGFEEVLAHGEYELKRGVHRS